MKRLSHVSSDGRVRMVDVSAKPHSFRTAIATGKIKIKRATANAISGNRIGKGNVFATAQIAGIQAAKRTAELIPLCHPLPLSNVEIDFAMKSGTVRATCSARTAAQTGVALEGLGGAVMALLTICGMCNALAKEMESSDLRSVKRARRAI